MTDLFILAGEASGDLYGGRLVEALRQRKPDLLAFGVAGPRMVEQGVEPIMRTEELSVMGFTDVIRAIVKLRKQLLTLKNAILTRQPPLVVLIDYAGLNIRLARALRKAGYRGKIAHYISPKVWAWGRHRIKHLAAHLDLLLTIFPFEADYFEGSGLRVEYVGSPLIEEQNGYQYEESWRQRSGFTSDQLIGLFPGSRPGEIQLNAKRHLETASLVLRDHPNAQFALSVANERIHPDLLKLKEAAPDPLRSRLKLVPRADAYNLMSSCDAALATSGTVNLELALHRVPHVVVYRVSHLNALIARCIFRVKLPHYSIANIVHGKTFLPELIYLQFTAKRAARKLRRLLRGGKARDACLEGCEIVRNKLSSHRPSERAAELLLALIGQA